MSALKVVKEGIVVLLSMFFFFSSRRRHTRLQGDWSSDVCSSDLWLASFSRVARSGPTILTELAPFTPDRPSWTLSWMYCEKLKLTPGNSASKRPCSSRTRRSLVMPGRHLSKGDRKSTRLNSSHLVISYA